VKSFAATTSLLTTKLGFVLDPDDETRFSYPEPWVLAPEGLRRGMTDPLNEAVRLFWDDYDVIGFVGDDHRFRTPSWDAKVIETLAEPGFAYGDDLFQRQRLATHVFVSTPIIKALGWLALPDCCHLYLDNAWMYLGGHLDRLHYMDDVIVEHEHPLAGKASWDEGYNRVNAQSLYDSDGAAYARWEQERAPADLERVRAAL
jgi:hypothetical protein